jgi:bla regulator protein BlaR1
MNPILNHLWQSTLFAALAALLTLSLKHNHARARYWVWFAASAKFLIPFALLVTLGSHIGWRAPAPTLSRFTLTVEEIGTPFRAALTPGTPSHKLTLPASAPSILIMIWAFGCAGTLVIWRLRWLHLEAALKTARPLIGGLEREALQRVTTSPVRLVSSRSTFEPGVFGILRPVIMLPDGIAERLTDAQLEAILAHEVCHIRRRDNLAAAFHMLVEALFWFHPLVWWVGSRLVKEREQVCDEEVLRLGSEPQVYAEGILRVCRFYLESPLHCAAGITGTNLKQRVKDIMGSRSQPNLDLPRKLLLTSAAFAALAGPILFGMVNLGPVQASAQAAVEIPSFDVASIRPSQPKTTGEGRMLHMIKISPEGLTANNISFSELIQFAYNVAFYEISGPEWLKSERYEILAKTATPVALDRLKLMTRTLVEERFKFSFHREKREAPVYALVVGKNGPKLATAKSGAEKYFRVSHGSFIFRDISLAEFAEHLSDLRTIDRPVVDRSGLQGTFDITMDGGAAAMLQDEGQSIFTLIQEQLGLTLKAQNGSLDILVVDHAAKSPTDN